MLSQFIVASSYASLNNADVIDAIKDSLREKDLKCLAIKNGMRLAPSQLSDY